VPSGNSFLCRLQLDSKLYKRFPLYQSLGIRTGQSIFFFTQSEKAPVGRRPILKSFSEDVLNGFFRKKDVSTGCI
jgi:hypothetical protein